MLNIDEVHVSGLDMDPEVAEARPMLFFLLEAGQIPNWRNIQVVSLGEEIVRMAFIVVR